MIFLNFIRNFISISFIIFINNRKFQYENYESAQNYLESLPWEFKENKIEDLRKTRAKLLSEELEKQKKLDEEIKNNQDTESSETQEPEEPDQELDELIRKSEL